MSIKVEEKASEDFCHRCKELHQKTGFCNKILKNVRENPNFFHKKCNGKYFSLKKESELSDKENERRILIKGRLNRSEFALRFLGCFILGVALRLATSDSSPPFFLIFVLVATGAIAIYSIIFTVQRFHDMNKGGEYYLLFYIPIVNIYWLFNLFFRKGTKGSNTYGDDPLELQDSQNANLEKKPSREKDVKLEIKCLKCNQSEQIFRNKIYDVGQYMDFEARVKYKFGFQKLFLKCKNCGYYFRYYDLS